MKISNKLLVAGCAVCLSLVSCKKFLDVEVPKSNVEQELVFESDVTATGAVLGAYVQMYAGSGGEPFASGRSAGLSSVTGLSSDEFTHPSLGDMSLTEFEHNGIIPNNNYSNDLWKSFYKVTYQANTIIEGVENSTSLTPSVKDQLLGEGYFIRAFCHFYLVNLFGDVPLILTTDYKANAAVQRTAASLVLDQVTSDLLRAYELLNEAYIHQGAERIRPNRSAAAAMLARVYLYRENWSEAEQYATLVIDKKTLYHLEPDLSKVFLKNSMETIWQIQPLTSDNKGTTNEAIYFSADNAPYFSVCTEDLLLAFEENDARYTQWLQPTVDPTFVAPYKYRHINVGEPLAEYSMVIRLAELHLIRAEARAMQNKLLGDDGAEFDINEIRERADLPATTATTQAGLLAAIMQERRVELFSEWGHRWFDLKRWHKADEILSAFKGSDWQPTDVLYPIPEVEMHKNPHLKPQNEGYN